MTKYRQPISSLNVFFASAALIAAVFGIAESASAYFEGNHRYDGQSIVNGVDFKLYKSFPEKWHLITTGYTEESAKLTLVYANPPAYVHLQKLKKTGASSPFPDGAVLGRVLFATEKDPRVAGVLRPTPASCTRESRSFGTLPPCLSTSSALQANVR